MMPARPCPGAQMFESMTKHLFRKARLPLDQACWQVRTVRPCRARDGACGAAAPCHAGARGCHCWLRCERCPTLCHMDTAGCHSFSGHCKISGMLPKNCCPNSFCSAPTWLQAGVDLGTAVKEYEDAVRAVKKGAASKAGGKRGAARAAKGQAAKELAQGGVQIRPKRRMPVSEVRPPRAAARCAAFAGRLARPSAPWGCAGSPRRWSRARLSLPTHVPPQPGAAACQPPASHPSSPPARCCWWAAPRACPPSAALCAT